MTLVILDDISSYLMTLRRLAPLDHWMTDDVARCKCFVIDYVMQGKSFTFMVLDCIGRIKKIKQIAGKSSMMMVYI